MANIVNFAEYTKECLAEIGKTVDDITWIGNSKSCYMTVEEFFDKADVDINLGYAGDIVSSDLEIHGKGFVLIFNDYDSSGSWVSILTTKPRIKSDSLNIFGGCEGLLSSENKLK